MSEQTNANSMYTEQDGVHYFTLLKSNRAAMDEFIELAEVVFDRHIESGEMLRVLVDFRPAGLPPLGYAVPKLRAFLADRRANMPPIRAAYMHNSGAMVSLLRTFMDMMPVRATERRIFNDEEEAEALAWLLEA